MSRLAVVFILDDVNDEKESRKILENIYLNEDTDIFKESSCYFAFKFGFLKQNVRLIPQKDISFNFKDVKQECTNMRIEKMKNPDDIQREIVSEEEDDK